MRSLTARAFTPSFRAFIPRHSARSRGIQKTRAWIVLPELLDAATTRSMTGGGAQRGGMECRVARVACGVTGMECRVAGTGVACGVAGWRAASTTPRRGIDADTEVIPQGFDALAYRVVHADGRPPFSIRLAAPFVRRVEAELGA